MALQRRASRSVMVGTVQVGGGAPVSVQTMTKAAPDDIETILEQIRLAEAAGCAYIRLAIPNTRALTPFAEIKKRSPLPLVADIHFNADLAVGAIEAGADKIRINPGNMKDWEAIERVVVAAKEKNIAIRVGGNSGSILDRAGDSRDIVSALVEETLGHCRRIEAMGFHNIVLSLKAADAPTTIEANRIAAAECDYPLHVGVTHAGPEDEALLKSAVGIGGLLAMGIGDTIRVSMTADPVKEVKAGLGILRAAGVLRDQVEIISCPTCGRCRVGLEGVMQAVRERLEHIHMPLTVAVMGCEVNGPGEAAGCDIGIAAGKGKFALFAGGKLMDTVPEEDVIERLVAEVEALVLSRCPEAVS